MKRKINFLITIGSYWPEKEYEDQIVFPRGGYFSRKEIEFETDNVNPMNDAYEALKEERGNTPYHIWYWTWLD